MKRMPGTGYRMDGGRTAYAALLLRVVVGCAFLFHGWPKVADPAAFAAQLHLPLIVGLAVAWVEFLGGALVLLGLLTPVAAALVAFDMVGALLLVHFPHHDPFVNPAGRSFELAAVYLAVMVALLMLGPGAFSADAFLFRLLAQSRPRARSRRRGAAL